MYLKLDQNTKAEPLLRRALSIYEATLGADHPEIARCLTRLAGVYTSRGDFARAEPLCRRALAIHDKIPPTAAADFGLVETLEEYASLLRNMNRSDEAARFDARARELRRQQRTPLPAERDA